MYNIQHKDILQANATIIAGLLILMTVSSIVVDENLFLTSISNSTENTTADNLTEGTISNIQTETKKPTPTGKLLILAIYAHIGSIIGILIAPLGISEKSKKVAELFIRFFCGIGLLCLFAGLLILVNY
jgi:hypothetical protein